MLCTPVAVLCGVTWHVSLAGHHSLPWGRAPHTLLHWCFRLSCWRCEGLRVVWRALLLCNMYKHMRALMCMCLTLFLASSQLLLVLSLPCHSPSCLSVSLCVCTSISFTCDPHLCSPLLPQTLLEKALAFGSHSAVPHSSSEESSSANVLQSEEHTTIVTVCLSCVAE